MSKLIAGLSDADCASINQDSPLWALVMSFEHERIHVETSSVLITELPLKYVQFPRGLMPSYYPLKPVDASRAPEAGLDYPVNEYISVPAQTVTLGKPVDHPSFGWDNEYGRREYSLPAFKAAKFKVTNGEFLEFVKDGGYSRPELWTKTGWEWR